MNADLIHTPPAEALSCVTVVIDADTGKITGTRREPLFTRPAEAQVVGGGEELHSAAKAFYNATIADSEVILRCPNADKQNAVASAGQRLRAALSAQPRPGRNLPVEAVSAVLEEVLADHDDSISSDAFSDIIDRLCNVPPMQPQPASAPVGVDNLGRVAADLYTWANEPFVTLTPMRKMDVEVFARRIAALAQQPAAPYISSAHSAASSAHLQPAPVGVEGLPDPVAVKYPDSGLRDDAHALALWNAHGYDTGGDPLFSAEQMQAAIAQQPQPASAPVGDVGCTCHYLPPRDCPYSPHRAEPDRRQNAPVGVEGLPPDVQEMIREDEAGWALAKLAESHGAVREEDDNDLWWTLRIEQFKALAQQPAAVDEAMVRRAARAWCARTDTPFDALPGAGRVSCLKHMRETLAAALAQPQGEG